MLADLTLYAVFVGALACLALLLGRYLATVFNDQPTLFKPIIRPVEGLLLAAAGIKPDHQQHWTGYALSLLVFNAAGFVLLYGILRLQNLLPLNPLGLDSMSADQAFNTAVSFVTNTNWQSYGGESTLTNLTQMIGLTTQNFMSAATGIAVAVAVSRAVASRSVRTIGSFWVDLVRTTLYVLLPISIVYALFLVTQGMPQTLAAAVAVKTLEGKDQLIALGPVASQVAIKMLGTNGGGFFNANAAHPFENPTALSNFVQILSILAIPAALPFMFGRMVGDRRQGYAIFAAMTLMFVVVLLTAYLAERAGNPLLAGLFDGPVSMEGKEVRFGLAQTMLFVVATTVASCGAVNAMHDSLMALAGMVPMINILVGEVIYGGVGAGFYGFFLFVVLTVFLAGLMVGRTPEYLGKKIEAREMKLAALTLLVMPVGVLAFSAASIASGTAQPATPNAGPHGLSELVYAYTSATGNNGSAFAGFSANTLYHNVMLAFAMMLGRFGYIVPVLAIAGSLAAKKTAPASAGTFPTHGTVFVVLIIATIVIVGALTFLPVLALGPIAEHVSIVAGQSF